jgi:hypothetical protein
MPMSEEPHPEHPSWERLQWLLKLLVSAIEPIARLIDAVSKLR